MIVANTHCQSFLRWRSPDAYLSIDESTPAIRRVEYDVDKELMRLAQCGFPRADWTAKDARQRQRPDALSFANRAAGFASEAQLTVIL